MLIPNQKVVINVNPANIHHYEERGYKNLICRKESIVNVDDLTKSAMTKVWIECDYCHTKYQQPWKIYKTPKRSNKDACKDCLGKQKNISRHEHYLKGNSPKALMAHEKSKYSYEYVKENFNEKNYKLISDKYIGYHEHLQYICKKHPDIGLQTTTLDSMITNRHNCIECAKYFQKNSYTLLFYGRTALEVYKNELKNNKQLLPKHFFDFYDLHNLKPVIDYVIELFKKDGLIVNEKDFLKSFKRENLRKYKLGNLLIKYSIFDIVNLIYPNKWKPWELNAVPAGFWDDDRNIAEAGKWFVEKLKDSKIIESDKDLITIRNFRPFIKKYRLEGLINTRFSGGVYQFFNFLYPNRWYQWEFYATEHKFWLSKFNRLIALKQLINKLQLNTNELPKHISYPFLVKNFRKFSAVCDIYYHSNLYEWINECYPNKFISTDFYNNIASDGTRLDSKKELLIHELLLSNKFKIKYYENKQTAKRWTNSKFNEYYVPDWIINDTLIVEYFGLYVTKCYGDYNLITNYIDKADRKIKYFNGLKNYEFIALFEQDLKNNYEGLINKFAEYGYTIEIDKNSNKTTNLPIAE
jgi:hypothetical protein